MTTTTAPPGLRQPSLPARVDDLADRLRSLEREHDALSDLLTGRIGELEEEVAALRRAVSPTPVAEVDERLAAFLDTVPGIKFSAVSVAENLGLESGYCSDRLTALAGRGRIVRQQAPNRRPLYYSTAK